MVSLEWMLFIYTTWHLSQWHHQNSTVSFHKVKNYSLPSCFQEPICLNLPTRNLYQLIFYRNCFTYHLKYKREHDIPTYPEVLTLIYEHTEHSRTNEGLLSQKYSKNSFLMFLFFSFSYQHILGIMVKKKTHTWEILTQTAKSTWTCECHNPLYLRLCHYTYLISNSTPYIILFLSIYLKTSLFASCGSLSALIGEQALTILWNARLFSLRVCSS